MKAYAKCAFVPLLIIQIGIGLSCNTEDIGERRKIHRLPRIEPDYAAIVIPPNIAPLDFVIQENGIRYRVNIVGTEGEPIVIDSKEPGIRIPLDSWHTLVTRNKGKEIWFVVAAQDSQHQWMQFDSIRNSVAPYEIDRYLVYRLLAPLYILWKKMEIDQRDLSNFDEKPVLSSKPLNDGCFNCHSFLHNSPDDWIIHLRGAPSTSMLLTRHGKTVLVDTKTSFSPFVAAYPAWHPSGKFLAFSVNKIKQFFHMLGDNRDVYDLASDLMLYDVDSNTVATSPSIADRKRLETYPEWSADGKYLYFCSAPAFDTSTVFTNDAYKKIRYDLMRVAFDLQSREFGKAETVLAAAKTGLSITQPRISPDGRFLLFCMSAYGNFPVYRSSSDLYMMDLQSGQYRRLEVNSDRADSHHCWSSNGRWFVFSSKREDGIHARPYFSYVDEQGNVHKPFVLPQEDPAFYEAFLNTYNRPELITGPISQSPQELIKVARQTSRTLRAKFVSSPK